MHLAALATATLDIQYYLWQGDNSGLALTHEVLQAAERGVRVFRLDARSGALSEDSLVESTEPEEAVAALPEVRLMRSLSPFYRVVSRTEDGRALRMKDLRVRNFGTRFGELEVRVGEDGNPSVETFHV